jgi:mono/diheme cytochrome c family protein
MSRIHQTFAVVLLTLLVSNAALADPADLVGANSFPERDGQHLYMSICQGCHMSSAKGATGAGTYPPLANDPRLAGAAYPISMVLYGQKDMPGFGGFLDDAQVAEEVNYVQTHFGNNFDGKVTADDVKALRQPNYQYFTLD